MNFRPAVKRLCAQLIWFNFLTLWHQALCWFGVHLMEVSHFIVTYCCLLPHFKTESSISLIHFILTLIWQEWNDYKRMCEIIGFVKKRKQDRAHNSEWHSLLSNNSSMQRPAKLFGAKDIWLGLGSSLYRNVSAVLTRSQMHFSKFHNGGRGGESVGSIA